MPNIDNIGFVLADQSQVAYSDFYDSFNIGLVVSVLGMHSRKPVYPSGAQHVNVAIAWDDGRNEQFIRCVPDIVAAVSQCKMSWYIASNRITVAQSAWLRS